MKIDSYDVNLRKLKINYETIMILPKPAGV